MSESELRDPDEPYAGKDLGSRNFLYSDSLRDHYFEGLGIDPSWYEAKADGLAAPAMIVGDVDDGFRGSRFKNAFGNLWMRQEWQWHDAILPRTDYHITSKILDIYDWRNRTVVKQEVNLFDDEEKLVARGVHHQSYLLSQSTGKVELRDPKKKEGVRKFEIPAGDMIEPVDRTIDLEMCGVFFHGNKNYHTDKQASEDIGFEEVVVGGKMTMSLIGDMLEKHFNDGFSKAGTLDIKFTNIVWPNDHVTAKGVIVDTASENDVNRTHLDVWMEKDDGTVVIVGKASALTC